MEKDETIVVVIFCNCKVADTPDSMGPGSINSLFFYIVVVKQARIILALKFDFLPLEFFYLARKCNLLLHCNSVKISRGCIVHLLERARTSKYSSL